MADGVSITAGTGTKILTDDTGTPGHAQVVKLAISADGDGTLLPADAANGLDVDVTRVTGTVTIGGVAATDAAVSGNPVLAGARASAAAPTAMSADGDAVPLWTDRRGALHTVPGAAGSATLSNVNDTASTASLLASNTSRRGVLMHNNSTATLYVKYGATASIAAGGYSVKIPADGYWEMPQPIYQGAIDGIWSVDASGYVNITEIA